MKTKHRAFLKWAGGKYGLREIIRETLPKGDRLVEPFVGAGSVFLNTEYEHYLLNDINQDLINLYQIVQRNADQFVADAAKLFSPSNNQSERYYQLRAEFNASQDKYRRSLLFLYLNRHGYNGLCRYNKSGGYNVPFGRYVRPYFPENELYYFAEKSQKATFVCESFRQTFARVESGDVVYCDPPYVALSKTANFTSYSGNGFGLAEQADLADAASEVSNNQGIAVLISNHDTPWTRDIYQKAAKMTSLAVTRNISQKVAQRDKVMELLALYQA
jgi:DNA adenine methylase